MRHASRASDLVLIVVAAIAVAALVPVDPVVPVPLGVPTVTLIAWPLAVLLWLVRRWARVGDVRFVLIATLLTATAIASNLVAIAVTG